MALEASDHADTLTGLQPRAAFLERLSADYAAQKAPFSLLFVHIDKMALINDSFGLDVGDAIIRTTAETLRASLGQAPLARTSGTEFAFTVAEPRALPIAQALLDTFRANVRVLGREVPVSLSIGCSLDSNLYPSSDAMLKDARLALQQVKQAGGGDLAVASPSVRAKHDLGRLEMDLRALLKVPSLRDQDQLFLRYQPLVTLAELRGPTASKESVKGSLAGFEALTAWRHPDLGAISPLTFIPLAERTGLIHQLGHWIIDEGLAQRRVWRAQGAPHVRLNINVSALQLASETFVERVRSALLEHDYPAEAVTLELTESANIELLDDYPLILAQLRELGLSLALDDFGTGYSSLTRLSDLPISSVKIDKAFVQTLATRSSWEIVRLLSSIAHMLGMGVVAEGIETEAQLLEVQELGCDEGQGYYFSKPISALEAAALIRK